MKKFILLSVLGLMIMGFSVSANAVELQAFGMIDAQWFYNVNATGANPAGGFYDALPANFKWSAGVKGPQLDRKVNYFESRARLGFNAIVDKNLMGTILFEMDANPWGTEAGGTRNAYGYWAGDRASVEVKNVYFDFGLPYIGIPAPMSFRVGLQTLAIRPNLFLLTDGMAIKWTTKIDPVALELFYGKPYEGRTAVSQDDSDVLGAHLLAKVGPLSAGGYAFYYNMNQYPFPAAALSYGSTGSFDAEMWWFGLYADGRLGPVNINLDAIYDWGKVKERDLINGIFSTNPDVKYRGWAARAKIDFPWEKFNFGVSAYYATGADTEKTSPFGLPGQSTSIGAASTKVNSFVIPPGSESGAAFGESVVFYSFFGNRGDSGIANTLNYTQMCRGPIGGTWMAKAYASVMAAPWYKITLQGMYIGDTTKNGDTFGNAISYSPITGISSLKDEKSIGWEIDLINEIQIYKNLKLTAAGGYMFAGKAMDQWTGTGFGIFPLNDEIKNPWALMWNLTYSF